MKRNDDIFSFIKDLIIFMLDPIIPMLDFIIEKRERWQHVHLFVVVFVITFLTVNSCNGL